MRLLVDTHVLIWWADDKPIGRDAGEAISDPANDVWVSAATIWESEIKTALGKLAVDGDLVESARDNGFAELAVTFEHALAAGRLPSHHRDPFDRMLIAQAQLEGFTVVTRDPAFRDYDVPLLAA